MPLYMDFHKGVKGLSLNDLEHAHMLDVKMQDQFGVKYHKFFINEVEGTVFCLMEAPDKEACSACHREAHGNMACEIIEVNASDFSLYMGPGQTTVTGIAVHPDGKTDSAVRSFLFTDIVGSTSLTEHYGDITAMTILRAHNEIVRNCIQLNSGTEVKHTGDGIMATFLSSSKSVRSALQMQKYFAEYREGNPEIPLHVKIGINAGEPVTEGGDFFGAAVQLSKRICDFADPDQVLVSDVVKSLCMGRNLQFTLTGSHHLKGFVHPENIYIALS